MVTTQISFLFVGLLFVLLLALYLGFQQRRLSVELSQLQKKLKVQSHELQESLKQQDLQNNQIHTKLLVENHQYLAEEKEELATHFTQALRDFEQQTASLTAEMAKVGDQIEEVKQEQNQWQGELEQEQIRLKEEYQQYQEFIEEQLQKVTQHNNSLPEQLDVLTSKLAQIKQLRHELNEMGQPLSLNSWREQHNSANLEEIEKTG